MADFEFNTDDFNTAIREYTDAKDTFDNIKTTLLNRLEGLKNTSWQSEAGEKFFAKYQDNWSKNVEKYIDTLGFMIEHLQEVERTFDGLAQEAEKLQYHG